MKEIMDNEIKQNMLVKTILNKNSVIPAGGFKCYRKKWYVALLSLALPTICHSASIPLGGTYTKPISATIEGTASVSTSLTVQSGWASAYAVKVGTSSGGCQGLGSASVVTSDGWYGYSIAPDIVLGISSGTISGGYYDSKRPAEAYNSAGAWSALGIYTQVSGYMSTDRDWCGTSSPNITSITSKSLEIPSIIQGNLFVHAGPKAKPGTYTIPSLYLTRVVGGSWGTSGAKILSSTQTITVRAPTDCTISTPDPIVDFGVVQQNPNDNQLIKTEHSILTINCSAVDDGGDDSRTAPMTLSFSGVRGRWVDTLAMSGMNSQGYLAEVRGSTGSGGICDTDPDLIRFDSTPISLGNLGVGQSNIPLTWSLCSNGSGLKGTGQAQATINLNWP